MAKSSIKKKKGPKGKKARAKAKLERQWGEEAPADAPKKALRGSQQRKKTKKKEVPVENDDGVDWDDPALRQHNDDADDDDEGGFDDDGSEDDEEEMALDSLMQSISKHQKRKQGKNHNDDDDENQDDMEATDDESDEEEQSDDDNNDEDDECDDMVSATVNFDLFSSHFNRDDIPETDEQLLEYRQQLQTKLTKISAVDDVDIHLSPNLHTKLVGDGQTWSSVCQSAWANNRQLLKDSWRSRTKKLHTNPLQSVVYPCLASYADTLVTTNHADTVPLHVLNHIMTSKQRVSRNNKRLAAAAENEDGEYRDQGYTRATVLVLLPTKGLCWNYVCRIRKLMGLEDDGTDEHVQRFNDEYGPEQASDDDDIRRKKVLQQKGKEWNDVFGDKVNSEDDFKLGLSIKGDTCKLYSDFYKSDVILASPIGLKVLLEDKQDTDFLSSIEICHVAHSDVLLMQNWDHLHDILVSINQQPKASNETDFSRVRNYLLRGHSAHWRQLIVSTKILDPSILATFKRHAKSIEGQCRVIQRTPPEKSVLMNVMVPTKQVFTRLECPGGFVEQGATRLKYFEDKVLPQLKRLDQTHTLVFVPSYFDFIAVRNTLLKKEMVFVSVTEYARTSEISRGRARFLQGRKPIMLYTGRCHYFQRHHIKGAKHLIMYGLPEHPEFYPQILNSINPEEGSCLSLFTKYEAMALERIVGRQHSDRMLKAQKNTFMFVS